MFFPRSHLLAVVAAVSVLAAGPVFAQGQPAQGQPTAPKKEWKDRAEYDLYEVAGKALAAKPPDAAKALAALDQWKSKYPTTAYDLERQQLYFSAYEAQGQFDKAIEAGNEALRIDPKDLRTLYGMTALIPRLKNPTPDMLNSAGKAAKTLAGDLASLKPANVSAEDWKKAEGNIQVLAHTSLGLIAQQRKDNEGAEKEFKEVLKLNSNNGQAAYYLGTVILAQKKPDTQAEALFYFARAAAYDGPGALTPEGRKDVQNYLTKAYVTFHGGKEGLDQLLALAKTNPAPPAGFSIKTGAEIEAEKQQEFQKSNPQLALWLEIKNQLAGADGEKYFAEHMKDAAVPELKGRLISQKPARNPKELVLGISGDSKTPEVTLKLTEGAALVGTAEPGTEITFEGVPVAFTKAPFMVTFDVEKAKIKGWTGKAAPPARKAPPKKGSTKKK